MSRKVSADEVTEIERIERPTREEFDREYVNRNKPVIITGVADKWAAAKWTPEYLKSVAGDAETLVHFAEDKDFHSWYGTESERTQVKMPFGEFLDTQNEQHDERYYMAEHTLADISPKLCEDFDTKMYRDVPAQIFIAWNSYMPLHYHGNTDTFLCQTVGTKRIRLYHPDQFQYLYVYPWDSGSPYFSGVDLRDPDVHGKFPDFKKAKPVEFDLHPGEMLFIPVQWWHVTWVPNALSVSLTLIWHGEESNYTFPLPALHWYMSLAARAGKNQLSGDLVNLLGTPGPGHKGAAHSPAMSRILAAKFRE